MSITEKDLHKIKSELRSGDIIKIAHEISRSQPWVSKVLANIRLASKHSRIIHLALDLIEERKEEEELLRRRIQEVTQ